MEAIAEASLTGFGASVGEEDQEPEPAPEEPLASTPLTGTESVARAFALRERVAASHCRCVHKRCTLATVDMRVCSRARRELGGLCRVDWGEACREKALGAEGT